MYPRILALLLLGAALVVAACGQEKKEPVKKNLPPFSVGRQSYGKIDGQTIDLFTLKNTAGMRVQIINYGATLVSVRTPDRDGNPGETILGFASLKDYLQEGNPYFGCTVGRYANRIAGARFKLDGKTYHLAANDNGNALHGGLKGFDKVVWSAEPAWTNEQASLRLRYSSPDGEEGYPGKLDVTVTYTLTGNNVLVIEYVATSDKPTPVNLTNHAYFNLSGGQAPDILGHELQIFADSFTPVNNLLIPIGTNSPVAGTAMDFNISKPVGRDLAAVPGGYDHNYILRQIDTNIRKVAVLYDPGSGRRLTMYTTEPGVQFYSGNFLDGSLKLASGQMAVKHAGLCLETQLYPDSPNQPRFPDVILRPGQVYRHKTMYHFSVLNFD